MNFRAVLFVLGNVLLLYCLCLVVPLIISVAMDAGFENGWQEILAFGGSIVVSAVLGGILRHLFAREAQEIRIREGFLVVSLSWLAMGMIGVLPYIFSGSIPSITDAFFETMSGLTTTGATILTNIEALPNGVQFWRCMTQWIGGMGIVVLSVALLPFLGTGGYHLLRAETPGGVAYERDRPRMTDNAKLMWKIYLGLTGALMVILWVEGMSPFDAACHAFTTMSTGGFSPHTDSVAYFRSPIIEWTITVFMFMAGMNFSLHAFLLNREWRPVLKDTEFRFYALLFVVVSTFFAVVVPIENDLGEHIRTIAFQVVSIATTTGYATADYDTWPQVVRFAMVILMFIGGSMGSTAGGIKVTRWVIYAKALIREMHHMIFPHAVEKVRLNGRSIDLHLVLNLFGFAMIWLTLFVVGAAVVAACGYDLPTAASASVSALGNIGPGLAEVGPSQNWAHLPIPAKWCMSVLMMIGRLEVYSVLILFTPWLWQR